MDPLLIVALVAVLAAVVLGWWIGSRSAAPAMKERDEARTERDSLRTEAESCGDKQGRG